MALSNFLTDLFGFSVKKTESEEKRSEAVSFVAPTNIDGAVTVEGVGGSYGVYVDIDGAVKDEFELITRYRDMSLVAEVDTAIDDIVNEAIVMNGPDDSVKIDLSEVELEDTIKEKIENAFLKICKLLNWNAQAYDIFKKWYIDGRLFYHIVLEDEDKNNTEELLGEDLVLEAKKNKEKSGILELRYVDPRQIRKIRVLDRELDSNNMEIVKLVDEYYIYNQRGIQYQGASTLTPQQSQTIGGIKIKKDCVVYIHSGITDKFSSTILSNLHKAIKPLNQLKMMEDALVIYRIARAPERRIFYVNVGSLPQTKAEEYLRSVMAKYRSKMIYDVNSGDLKTDRKHLSMLEDFFIPVKDGQDGTKIDTLQGGENLGKMEDVDYFLKKVYKALNVPTSRLDPENSASLGRATEIKRDESKFSKMIFRYRLQFQQLFLKLLETELIVSEVFSREEWEEIKDYIDFVYADDNKFSEISESEIMKGRLEILGQIDPDSQSYTKKYYSQEWIRKNVLKQTEDEQKQLDKEIKKEKAKAEKEEEQNPQEEEQESLDSDNTKPVPVVVKKSLV